MYDAYYLVKSYYLIACTCVCSMKITWSIYSSCSSCVVLDSVLQQSSCPVFRVSSIGVQVVVGYMVSRHYVHVRKCRSHWLLSTAGRRSH